MQNCEALAQPFHDVSFDNSLIYLSQIPLQKFAQKCKRNSISIFNQQDNCRNLDPPWNI